MEAPLSRRFRIVTLVYHLQYSVSIFDYRMKLELEHKGETKYASCTEGL